MNARGLVHLLSAALAAVLVWAVLTSSSPGVRLPAAVAGALGDTGVDNAVTGVLLAFRAYDTLLEIAVLTVAMLAAGHTSPPHATHMPQERAGAVLEGLVNLVVPLMIVVAGYLLWAGAERAGGAFQAGAVLAAAGVLLRLSGGLAALHPERAWVRIGTAAGLAVFLLVGAMPVLRGGAWFGYREPVAHTAILLIESALTLSIALALLALFVSAPRASRPDE